MYKIIKNELETFIYNDSKYNTRYNKLRIYFLGGSCNNEMDNENKIIKNISKEANLQNKKIQLKLKNQMNQKQNIIVNL
jgi:hypothetical protein